MTPDISISITKDKIIDLPTVTFDGEIKLINTPELAAQAVAELEKHHIIGFDTETKPSFQKGRTNKVALMQLSTLECCYLFRLNIIGLVDELARLLENENIIKIGLSIHDDFNVMHRSSHVAPKGFVELQKMVKKYCIADISLQKIYAILFGKRISKGQRLTNWEAPTLTHQQQVYAATDAWACLQIYNYLIDNKFDPSASAYIVSNEHQATAQAHQNP